jgi:hypothetical protein
VKLSATLAFDPGSKLVASTRSSLLTVTISLAASAPMLFAKLLTAAAGVNALENMITYLPGSGSGNPVGLAIC